MSPSNNSDLLQQLKLDKTPKAPPLSSSKGVGYQWKLATLLLLIGAGVGFAMAYFFLQQGLLHKTLLPQEALPEETPTVVTASTTNNINAISKSVGTLSLDSRANRSTAHDSAVNHSVLGNKILDASGYITARRIATVSAETTGLITSVDVEEGMLVRTGQVLATLDGSLVAVDYRLAQARVLIQEARLRSLQIDLAEAQRALTRLENLGANGDFSSESQLTRARADVNKLLANLSSAKADITIAQLNVSQQKNRLDDHTIRAPFSGVITAKNAQPGEIISPVSAGGGFTRTGICTIVDMNSLEIEVDVNEAFIAKINQGMRVIAKLDAYPDWKIPASVTAIIPTADRAKATVRVRIKIEINDSKILPDMGVKVSFYKNGDKS